MSERVDATKGRRRPRAILTALATLGAAVSLAACGGGDSGSSSAPVTADDTLTVPMSFNPGSLDPDVSTGTRGC